MLLPLQQDIERRRQMWSLLAEPLFAVVLDEEPWEADFQRIDRAAIELGYSDDDLRTIYWKEVMPAVVGTWSLSGFESPGWLEQRIFRPPWLGFFLTCLLCPWWIWITWDTWREIRRGIEIARQIKSKPAKEPFASIEDFSHEHK